MRPDSRTLEIRLQIVRDLVQEVRNGVEVVGNDAEGAGKDT